MTCMGVTWIIGFIASVLDNETLWWVFVLTNSLQGVLILLTTLCSSKYQGMSTGKRVQVEHDDGNGKKLKR